MYNQMWRHQWWYLLRSIFAQDVLVVMNSGHMSQVLGQALLMHHVRGAVSGLVDPRHGWCGCITQARPQRKRHLMSAALSGSWPMAPEATALHVERTVALCEAVERHARDLLTLDSMKAGVSE